MTIPDEDDYSIDPGDGGTWLADLLLVLTIFGAFAAGAWWEYAQQEPRRACDTIEFHRLTNGETVLELDGIPIVGTTATNAHATVCPNNDR